MYFSIELCQELRKINEAYFPCSNHKAEEIIDIHTDTQNCFILKLQIKGVCLCRLVKATLWEYMGNRTQWQPLFYQPCGSIWAIEHNGSLYSISLVGVYGQ